ncbi:MAG: hypothetical protein P1U64_01505 [Alcanivoracaceae bacterium]|nr:hypothetical protein [Alcanivoracaceae bacterium]
MLRLFLAAALLLISALSRADYQFELEAGVARETDRHESGAVSRDDVYHGRARVYLAPVQTDDQPYALAPFMTRASYAEMNWDKRYFQGFSDQPEVTGAAMEWQLPGSDFRIGVFGEHDQLRSYDVDRYGARVGWYFHDTGALTFTHIRMDDREFLTHQRELVRRLDYQQVMEWARQHIQFFAGYFDSSERYDYPPAPGAPTRLGADQHGFEWGLRFFPTRHLGVGIRYEESRRHNIFVPENSGRLWQRSRINYLDFRWDLNKNMALDAYYGFGDRTTDFGLPPPFYEVSVVDEDRRGVSLTLRF